MVYRILAIDMSPDSIYKSSANSISLTFTAVTFPGFLAPRTASMLPLDTWKSPSPSPLFALNIQAYGFGKTHGQVCIAQVEVFKGAVALLENTNSVLESLVEITMAFLAK
ncbi:MAG: hypothetical protein IPI77_24025 [Saprospiraceae bacterium]|nr:hypothetical protein [Saprospiraceae bacterium]